MEAREVWEAAFTGGHRDPSTLLFPRPQGQNQSECQHQPVGSPHSILYD